MYKTFFFYVFAPCTVTQLRNTNQQKPQIYKLIFNFYFLLSPTCFEPRSFILKETVVYAVW